MTTDADSFRLLPLLLVVAVAVSACAGTRGNRTPDRNTASPVPVIKAIPAPPAPPGSAQAALPPAYTFSPGDEFDLRVPDAPQFDQTLKVRPDGKFSLALLGTVQALNRTPEEVEADLRQRLQRLAAPPAGQGAQQDYLLQPNDDIELKFALHTPLNEVVKLRPDGKIQLQMIGAVQAAGLTPEALREVLLKRYARVLRNPDLTVLLRNATTQNVRVAGGTARAGLYNLQPTVIVRNFQLPQVFVGGEVLRPGVLAYRPGLTVIQAIAEAGWYLPTAELSKLMVLRRTADNGSQLLRPDFGVNLNGEQKADVALQPFDVVLLPKNSTSSLADSLNQYFNLLPPLRNSSLGFSYVLRDPNRN